MPYFPLPLKTNKVFHIFASITISAALVIASIAGLSPFMTAYVPNSEIARAFLNILDPLVLQGIAFFHCWQCLLLWKRQSDAHAKSLYSDLFSTFAVLFLLLVFYYVVNDFVYKPSFDRPRPAESLQLKIGFISKYLSPTSSDGAPSGFASRGTFLLLTSCLCCIEMSKMQRGVAVLFSKLSIVLSTQLFLLILTCTSRVFTGYHFWFDIFLGISLGVFSFWTLILLSLQYRQNRRFEESDIFNTLAVAVIIGFVIVGFFYSRNASSWAPVVSILVAVASLIQMRALFRHAQTGKIYIVDESEVEKL